MRFDQIRRHRRHRKPFGRCLLCLATRVAYVQNSDTISGFDFARAPYGTLKPSDYGQTGSTAVSVMDWLGRKADYNDVDHDGTDMVVARNTKIYALAAGKVIMARDCQSPCGPGNPSGSDSVAQKEVAIEHVVTAPNTAYVEKFVTYYAHFSSYSPKVGDIVTKGQQIGLAGSTGCSSALWSSYQAPSRGNW